MIERLVEAILDAILGLEGGFAYFVVGALAWAEAAFFLGLITPGEIAMALGGVLASRQQVGLITMGSVASIGTVLGNTTGYWLGRVWGRRILEWERLQRLLGDQIERTEEYFHEKGGRAIVIGRFASFFRIFVPFVAGASRMPYLRFLAYDVPTGAGWAFAWVIAGFILGQSWHVLRDVSGPAAFLVLTLIVVALLLRWIGRKLRERREAIRSFARRVRQTRPVGWLIRRYGDQLSWLGQRFDPRVARGLNLTLAFVVFVVALTTAGLVVNEALWFASPYALDVRVLRWFEPTRTEAALAISRVVVGIFTPPWAAVPALVLGGYAWWRRSWRATLRVAIGVAGAAAGAILLDTITVPGIRGTQFPSVPVAVSMALLTHLGAIEGGQLAWRRAVTVLTVGSFVVAVVAVAALVLNIAAPTGIAFAIAAAIAWSSAIELQARLFPGAPG